MRRYTRHCLAILGSAICASAGHAATTYSITNLGIPPITPPPVTFRATDVSNNGVVTGWSPYINGQTRGFAWQNGTFEQVPVGTGAPEWSIAHAINNTGQVAGGGWLSPAFIWNSSNDAITPIPDVNNGNSEGIFAYGINSRGAVVGGGHNFDVQVSGNRAFLWQPTTDNGSTGTLVDLGGGSAADNNTAWDVNDSGRVVGSRNSGGYVWEPTSPNGTTGAFVSLNTMTGRTVAIPQTINNAGWIAGAGSVTGSSTDHAFLFIPNAPNGTTGVTLNLTGASGGWAFDVNNLGQVVGRTTVGGNRAFLWSQADGLIDLNALLDGTGAGWTLEEAVAISDTGFIVGLGQFDPDGPGGNAPVTRSFLLTAVPEPATSALVGIVAMSLLSRRKRVKRVEPIRATAEVCRSSS